MLIATDIVGQVMDANPVEVYALRFGLLIARDACFLQLEVESDNLQLICSVCKLIHRVTYFDGIAQDCSELGSSFGSYCFSHVRRERNRVVHELTKNNTRNGLLVWLEGYPSHVLNLATLDVLSIDY